MTQSTPKIQALAIDRFYSSGRGPELQRIIWGQRGCGLCAIEYFNHDDNYDVAHIKHVRVIRQQVVMITPEEVVDFRGRAAAFSNHRPAAVLDYGYSDWLLSFNQYHLSKCHHFQLLFYDQLFDIICEGLEFKNGAFEKDAG